jgi:predicted 2-oxoglutarate/Fe(II)-dependent dioxygenase YbiX
MESKSVAPGIVLFENIVPDYKELVQEIEKVGNSPSKVIRWKRATVGSPTAGTQIHEARTNSSIHLQAEWATVENPDLNAGGQLAVKLINNIQDAYNKYKEYYPSVNSGDLPVSPIILRYQTGQKYDMHADAGGGNNRVLSLVWYVNNEYEGGEIDFPYFGYKLKPPANSMIFFPSNYIYAHIAHPVTDGTKYAVVMWILEDTTHL